MQMEVIDVDKPEPEINVIIGYTHFIKSVEDIYEALVTSVPDIKFGLAFCEASGARLIRYEGTDDELVRYAIKNCEKLGAGHAFIVLLRNAYPINVINALKNVQEITRILVASANPIQLVVGVTEQGRGILGAIDGFPPLGVEDESSKGERKAFLRKIGYKL